MLSATQSESKSPYDTGGLCVNGGIRLKVSGTLGNLNKKIEVFYEVNYEEQNSISALGFLRM